jgi:ribonuclease D
MAKKLPEYKLIRNQTELKNFYAAHQGQPWMAFDTEFVGERRYQTLLCLIQVASREGYFLIDPLEVDDLGPFLDLLVQPDLVKITHAGENDYRIFYDQFGILPRNVFDTQIAAGMVGYRYPLSFGKLTEAELGLSLDKGATVTNWEARPLSNNQIAYALNDVKPLYDLYSELHDRLERLDRVHWAGEEMSRLEKEGAYKRNFDLQVVNSRLMGQLKGKEQLIYLRLMRWRRQEAKRKDHSLEMVLSKKLLGAVTRGLARGGMKGLRNNRRIPDRLIGRYQEDWVSMLEKPMQENERVLLEQIPVPAEESPRREALLELLYQAIRFHCLHKGIAVELAFPRGNFRELKEDPEMQLFETGWRSELFGDSLLSWFKDSDQLDIRFSDHSISLVRTTD